MIKFWVPGLPVPQGSKIPGVTKNGRPYLRESSDKHLKPWRAAIKETAEKAREELGLETLDGPVGLSLDFVFPRLKSDPDRIWKYTAPDGSKIQRAVEDALTDAGVWTDDARVVTWAGAKWHGDCPGVTIRVWQIDTDERKAA